MTNADKYLKDGVDIEELAKELINFEIKDKEHTLSLNNRLIQAEVSRIKRFFEEPCKPTLTEDEKVILRNIPKGFIKIKRENYTKNIYVEKEKIETENDWEILSVFNYLFQFIQPRRRI